MLKRHKLCQADLNPRCQATAALRVGWQGIIQTVLPYLILEEPSNVEYLIAFLEAYQRQEMEEWGQEACLPIVYPRGK